MKRETVIAIALGIIVGIGIAVFVIISSRQVSDNAQDVIMDDITPTVPIETDEISPLLISEPENEYVTDKNSITIKGTAQEGSLVVIQTLSEEKTFVMNNSSFSEEINLIPGENIIRVTSYNDKNIDNRSLVIYLIESE